MKRLLSAAAALALAIGLGALPASAQLVGPANTFQYTPASPTGPNGGSAATPTMMGIGLSNGFTPRKDGVAILTVTGTVSNNTAGDGATIQLMYGAGTAPANGAAVTGYACGAAVLAVNGTLSGNVSNKFPFTGTCIATGLTLGTGYWIDIAAASTVNSTTTTFSNMNVTAVEQ